MRVVYATISQLLEYIAIRSSQVCEGTHPPTVHPVIGPCISCLLCFEHSMKTPTCYGTFLPGVSLYKIPTVKAHYERRNASPLADLLLLSVVLFKKLQQK